ncbi:MAG: 2Fe-2S iron-sulfur cluster-binding protein [Sphingomonadaceae bacterium]
MGYERQPDFEHRKAALARRSPTIDGRAVTVPAGTSVMRAAREAGGDIPSLCATDNVEAFGSCRMCLVEIEGRRGTPASCTTPAEAGMVVHTQNDRLAAVARGHEPYISDHPLDCLTCSANNICELQDTAAKSACAMSAMAMKGEPFRQDAGPSPTPISCLLPTNASSVCRACLR